MRKGPLIALAAVSLVAFLALGIFASYVSQRAGKSRRSFGQGGQGVLRLSPLGLAEGWDLDSRGPAEPAASDLLPGEGPGLSGGALRLLPGEGAELLPEGPGFLVRSRSGSRYRVRVLSAAEGPEGRTLTFSWALLPKP